MKIKELLQQTVLHIILTNRNFPHLPYQENPDFTQVTGRHQSAQRKVGPAQGLNHNWSKPITAIPFPLSSDWLAGNQETQQWSMEQEGKSAGELLRCNNSSGY